jgi:hypothetical protein
VSGHIVGFWSELRPAVPPASQVAPHGCHRPMKIARPCREALGALLALVLLFATGAGLAEPTFESPPGRDGAGFFSLSWSGAGRFELEQATGPDHADARIIYRGSDTATTISGLRDGEYRFRIRAESDSAWSDEAVVVVEHHALSRALLFFALGAGVFLVLVLAIARGRKLA